MNKIIKLDNGLKLSVHSMRSTRSIAIGVFVGTGSINETPINSGISHFIEHMLFKGTKKRTSYEIANEMESIGVQINAFTSKSMTAYYTVSLDEHAHKCAEMLADLYFNSTFTKDNLSREKGVVKEEINMGEDDPEDLCFEQLSLAHYGNHSLAMPILGTAKTVDSFSKKCILDYMSKYYTADNTVIAIVGNVTEKLALELVNLYFNDNFTTSTQSQIAQIRAIPQAKCITKQKSIEQANIAFSFPSYPIDHPNILALSLVNTVLGGGMSSRLFQKIREELGVAYSVYSAIIDYPNDGFLAIYLGTNYTTLRDSIVALRQILVDIIANGITELELTKGKEQLKSSMVLGSESSSSVMRACGKLALHANKKFDLDSKLKMIEDISQEDIKAAIDFVFNFDLASASYVGKEQDWQKEYDILDIFKGKQI